MILFLEKVFHTLIVVNSAEDQKNFKFGKFTKYDEDSIFRKKLIFLKCILNKIRGRKVWRR